MNVARAGHTATVLPDGTVFVFGGVGTDGKAIPASELYDPQSGEFSLLPDVFAIPRIFHTATLLTDGTVLLAGGVLEGGEFPGDVQLFDYRTRRALSQDALMLSLREGHTATLQSDGTVRVSGGTNQFGKLPDLDEIYDPLTKRFHFADAAAPPDASLPFAIATSVPEDGATNFPIQDPIVIRLTHLVAGREMKEGAFVLTGPSDAIVRAKVTLAESGRLVFVLPETPLESGTSYTLRIKGVTGVSGEELPETTITFQTEGAPPDRPGLDFIPGPTWTSGTGGSTWQQLPALQAAPGVTALSGQVLKINGWPLENLTIEIAGKRTHTDSTGRFLLTGVPAGRQVMWVDGATANHANATYGVHEIAVTILAGRTNALDYTIWITRLDTQHVMTIPSPTLAETVITNPLMPGLEVHLPANTTITDRYGKIVRQVSLTPVPLDKPPYPLPVGAHIPMYFTLQPGGAYISVGGYASSNTASKKDGKQVGQGARLVYANMRNNRPGTVFNFWTYDPSDKGWFIYGQGKVSIDGRSIVPNPGVEFYEFTSPNYGGSGAPNPGAPPIGRGNPTECCDPVDLSTGQFIYTKTDMAVADVVPINFTRTYISNDIQSRAFGLGATDNYDIFFIGFADPFSFQELILPDGQRIRFDRVSPGTDANSAVYAAIAVPGEFYGAVLAFNSDPSLPGAWTLSLKNGTVMSFPLLSSTASIFCQGVLQIKDRYGNITKIDRDPNTCVLQRVTSPNGRYLTFTNDAQSRITQLTDNIGRTVSYTYDSTGNLATVTDANGGVTSYIYDSHHRMLTVKDPLGIVYLTNQYDLSGRVTKQTQADGSTFLFSWNPTTATDQDHFVASVGQTDDGGGLGAFIIRGVCWDSGLFKRYDVGCANGYMALVASVDVTDPRGYVRRVKFGPSGQTTSDTHALGQPEEQTYTYAYYGDNLAQSVTDPLGRVTTYDYDGMGNLTRVTRLDGTPNAVTSTFAHNGPFAQLSSATDPLGHTSTFSYDQNGNLATATDALGHSSTFTYNSAGQPISATDALSNQVQFGYFGGDLAMITDPLGNVSTQFTDAVGRVVSVTDAQGNTATTQYSPLNLVTQLIEAKGANTSFTYDGNGNVLSLTDALNHTTNWTYDNMDRVATRKDPLNRQASYTYDPNGNLANRTDRKGQVTSFGYDALNRPKVIGYNTVVTGSNTTYESTTSLTYDGGNRLTQAVDSAGGTITDGYDNLDRITSEATAQGSITYGYDNAGRRTTMTVTGQPQVAYSYDNANRLTQIAQGTTNVGFSYDNANRRTSLTLPNGVSMAYSFDNDSRVTGITYNFGANTLGNLAYSYDQLGRRTQVGGSFARTNMPAAVSSASYDAANELTNWNGTAISFDANGNMLGDGTNTFTWNARNQLATLDGVALQYDAFGRRIKNAAGTSFLYDGVQTTQELSGTTVTANLWTGDIDELFQRSDSNGTVGPLVDALGSTLALVNSSGSVTTTYSYDPFGNTTTAGAASGNRSQYTGRENDGNGLYFYRARYYSPMLGRFVSEDPIGFGGGTNLYSYVFNSPTNLTDPSGNCPLCVGAAAGAVAGVAGQFVSNSLTGESGGYWGAALGGAAAGAILASTGNPYLAGGAGGAVSAYVNGDDVGTGALIGAVTGFIPDGPALGKGLGGEIGKQLPGGIGGGIADALNKGFNRLAGRASHSPEAPPGDCMTWTPACTRAALANQ